MHAFENSCIKLLRTGTISFLKFSLRNHWAAVQLLCNTHRWNMADLKILFVSPQVSNKTIWFLTIENTHQNQPKGLYLHCSVNMQIPCHCWQIPLSGLDRFGSERRAPADTSWSQDKHLTAKVVALVYICSHWISSAILLSSHSVLFAVPSYTE